MGAVWLGRDEVLGRQVALKRIGMLPGSDSTDLARAEREARLSAQLNHAHVVAIFDVVVDSDARWLVMEYVDGITLAQVVQRGGPLSPEDAAPLLRQVADALVAAHGAGIVHRDVKPSNVLVDRTWRVKLSDFGIARIETDAALTQTGLLTGSPAYLAPEVVTGGTGDQAADVWSLGATLFYVLSGRPPYDVADNVMSTLYRIVNDDPPRLADAGQLAPLLEATMVKDPSRRWSMTQVRDFLADPPDDGGHPGAQRPHPTRGVGSSLTTPALPRAWATPPRGSGCTPASVPHSRSCSRSSLVQPVRQRPRAEGHGQPSDEPTSQSAPAKPTAAGMESFIRDYVATVSEDPDKSWLMLTPKFQRRAVASTPTGTSGRTRRTGACSASRPTPTTCPSAIRSGSTTSRTAPARRCWT